MLQILTKAYTQVRDNTTVAGIATGGVHVGRAGRHRVMPYVVVGYGRNMAPMYTSGTRQIETTVIRYGIFSESREDVISLLEAIEAEFQSEKPSLTGDTCMAARRGGMDIDIDPEETAKGAEVWRGTIEIIFEIDRDPTT